MSSTRVTKAPEVPENRFLDINEAATILGFHPRTLREYLRRGEIQGRLIGKRWRFRRSDLDAFFEEAPQSWAEVEKAEASK